MTISTPDSVVHFVMGKDEYHVQLTDDGKLSVNTLRRLLQVEPMAGNHVHISSCKPGKPETP